jgi:hypothetical protein
MSHAKRKSKPRRRRTRTIFHYKVDETLRPGDRENYLALIRHPLMRNEDAHAWLLGRGYRLSLSAVARHRRRLTAGDAEHHAEARKTEIFARAMADPDAPDMAAGGEALLQHLVFRHLMNFDARMANEEDGIGDENDLINATELLRLSQLVKSVVDLTAARVRRELAKKSQPQGTPPTPRDDATLRKDIEDILARRK